MTLVTQHKELFPSLKLTNVALKQERDYHKMPPSQPNGSTKRHNLETFPKDLTLIDFVMIFTTGFTSYK